MCRRQRERKPANQVLMPSELTFNYRLWVSIVSQSLIRITRERVGNEHVGANFKDS